MLSKLLKLLLLLALGMTIVLGALLQTTFVQQRLAEWVEERAEGALQIGKLSGFLPFWIHLEEVHYQTEEIDLAINSAYVTLSPFTFLSGELTLSDLDIDHLSLNSYSPKAKSRITPLVIHSFKIKSFNAADLHNLTLSGKIDLRKGVDLQVKMTHPELPHLAAHFEVESSSSSPDLALTGHLKKEKNLLFCFEGNYVPDKKHLEGLLEGKGPNFHLNTHLHLDAEKLTLTSLQAQWKEAALEQGELVFSFPHHLLKLSGHVDHTLFVLETTLAYTDKTLSFEQLKGHMGENKIDGNLTYTFGESLPKGALHLALSDLTLLPLEHPFYGELQASLQFEKEGLFFTLEAQDLEWNVFFLPKLNATGRWDRKELAFELLLHDFTVLDPAYEVFPQAHLTLRGTANHRQLLAAGTLSGLGTTPFSLNLDLPLKMSSSPLALSIDPEGPFSLQLRGKGAIDPLLAFLENASIVAKGEMELDLKATGTWQNPVVEGYVIYDKGRIESLTTGALFRDIHLEMKASGKELIIDSLIAHDFERGDLSGAGSLTWDPEAHFPFSFTLYANRYTLFALDPLTAKVQAEITLAGNLKEMSITGNATLDEAHLALPNKMPLQVPTIDVVYLNPIETPKPESAPPRKPIPIYWDVEITAPRQLKIEGRGLVSEWSGSLRVWGEQHALNYSGRLKLVQGRFTIINRTFDLVEGKVRIQGLKPGAIFVNLKGDYELPVLTASIVVNGALDNPHLTLCSSPPMSTNQILSWILFNQDLNELSPFQACRLASILVSLSGNYSGPKTFSAIKEGLGIDVFSITDCDLDSTDFTFQVGKYLSQGTYVGINKSISGDFDSVLIQTRLYRDFYLEADYGGSLNGVTPNGGKVIFKWYKTY